MKARTKAAKIAAKRGRPFVEGSPERTPSGQKSRAREHVIVFREETQKQIMETALEARMRQALLGHGEIITEKEAKSRLRGFVLGLLFLDGDIDRSELSAGVWYADLMARYYGLVGLPFPSARAMELYSVRGHPGEVSAERAKMAREASERMMNVEGALLSLPNGRHVKSAVYSVCVEDLDTARGWPMHMKELLKAGLQRIYSTQDVPDWRA